MNRNEMKKIMMTAFNRSRFNHYVEKGWIITSDFTSFSLSVEKIHRDTCPSFDHNGLWVSVDFAAGAGCWIGLPTNQKQITVFYKDIQSDYRFERFTFNQFIRELWKSEFEPNGQLVLF